MGEADEMKNVYLYAGIPFRLVASVLLLTLVVAMQIVFIFINLFTPNNPTSISLSGAFTGLGNWTFKGHSMDSAIDRLDKDFGGHVG
jgi:hypothetical protein